jgi:hypothetical protein
MTRQNRIPKGKPPSQRPGFRGPPQNHTPSPEVDLGMVHLVALHEAGHAVAACVLGIPLVRVDIIPNTWPDGKQTLGFTECPIQLELVGATEEYLMPHLIQAVAGSMGEGLAANFANCPTVSDPAGWTQDMETARLILVNAFCQHECGPDGVFFIPLEEIQRKTDYMNGVKFKAIEGAESLIKEHAAAVLHTAGELIVRKSLTGSEVAAIVAANPPTLNGTTT